MLRAASKSIFWALALVVFSGLAFAQTGSLRGKVVNEKGEGVPEVLVKIERQEIRGSFKVKTNKRGEYFHAGLPIGTYNVAIELNGEVVDGSNGVRVTIGDPIEVDFDLAKAIERRKAAQSGQVTQEQLRTMTASEKKAYEAAVKEREKALSKNKELNDAFNAGIQAREAKDYVAAVDRFKAAAELDPKQHVVWANLADAQMALAQTKTSDERTQLTAEAIAAYDKAIELDPASAAYQNNKGLALVRAGKMDEGRAALEQAAKLDPPGAGRYYFNLGAVLVNAGNTEGAVEAFRKATEADPRHADAFYQLGTALVSKAEVAADGSIKPVPGTVEAFQKYIELQPNGPNAEPAKAMIASLTGAVSTSFQTEKKK
jgi:tetratricopeptide (TPR) repeat protein